MAPPADARQVRQGERRAVRVDGLQVVNFKRGIGTAAGAAQPVGAQRHAAHPVPLVRVVGPARVKGGHTKRTHVDRRRFELAADGASLVELQQAGGWRSPTTPAVYVRRESATRGPASRGRCDGPGGASPRPWC